MRPGSCTEWLLAHVTESRMKAPLDDPVMGRFAFAFDSISRLARASPGFRWQLEHEQQGHPVLHPDDPLLVINASAWVDYPALHGFVYRSAHGRALLRRAEWFDTVVQPATALWWIQVGHEPDVDSAHAQLSYLRQHGPTPRAFTLTRRFDVTGRPERRAR